MFSITLLCMGKLKEKFYTAAAEEYSKRLRAFADFRIVELPEYRLPDDPNETQIAQGLAREAEAIRKAIPKGAWLCVLTPEGRLLSSEELASALHSVKTGGQIGGLFSNRLVVRHRSIDQGDGRSEALDEQNDLSAPSGPRDGARAALPC